ncbi:hypothetical protein [Candidiatus Paracoxiella cheracis]|uniref:hypothetical protein n=1 Tax=Candidiatus Paracoxiella cheracis TaxID=3405120 RepID=UPI003BF4ECFA
MTARKDFLQSLTLGKKSEPTAEYAPSLRSPWRASIVDYLFFFIETSLPFRNRNKVVFIMQSKLIFSNEPIHWLQRRKRRAF